MPKHILITTIGSLGDLHPMLAAARELKSRGHRVTFVTHRDYAPHLAAIGVEFGNLRPEHISPKNPEMVALLMDLKKGSERVMKDFVMANVRLMYEDLMAASEDVDFIFAGELVPAASIVAEKRGIPWAMSVLAPTSMFSAHDMPVLPTAQFMAKLRWLGPWFNGLLLKAAHKMTASWADPVHQLRAELGLAAIGNPVMSGKFSPHLNFAQFSPVIGKPQPDWPAKTVQTGFPFFEGAAGENVMPAQLEAFLQAGEAPIVFTLGSAAVMSPGAFFRHSAEAARALGRRAVLLVGQNAPPAGLPDSILAVPYAPFGQLFPRAAAIVHQGGIGTTAQALRAGVPTIVVPYSHDQPDNADRLRRLGTSLTIGRNGYSSAKVTKALARLLGESAFREKAMDAARMVGQEAGAEHVADEILRVIVD